MTFVVRELADASSFRQVSAKRRLTECLNALATVLPWIHVEPLSSNPSVPITAQIDPPNSRERKTVQ